MKKNLISADSGNLEQHWHNFQICFIFAFVDKFTLSIDSIYIIFEYMPEFPPREVRGGGGGRPLPTQHPRW